MLDVAQRTEIARSAIEYITGRAAEEMAQPVPNCPGWTVYNAAVHVGRTSVFWYEMMQCRRDDATARDRALATMVALPEGVPADQLKEWGDAMLDRANTETEEPCFLSMAPELGTTWMWVWHAASEIGIHRLDVEAALGHEHELSEAGIIDSMAYACEFFMPAMARATQCDPGAVTFELGLSDGSTETLQIRSEAAESGAAASVTVAGSALGCLLAIWGRPHSGVEVTSGEAAVLERWKELPAESYQFGAWD